MVASGSILKPVTMSRVTVHVQVTPKADHDGGAFDQSTSQPSFGPRAIMTGEQSPMTRNIRNDHPTQTAGPGLGLERRPL